MGTFADTVRQFTLKAKDNLDKQTRAITLELFSSVITSSPVGNSTLWKHPAPKGYVGGRFRANWNTSVGIPDESTTQTLDPSGSLAINGVLQNMGGAGKVTFMANALPYGERLEFEGWSA